MRNGYGVMADGTRQLVVDQQYNVRREGEHWQYDIVYVDALLPADDLSDYNAVVTSIGGYPMVIHGYHLYDDNTVDWDYSTGGRFIYEEA